MYAQKLLSFNEFCNENLDSADDGFDWGRVVHTTLDFTSGLLGSFGVTAPIAMALDVVHAIGTFVEGKIKWDQSLKLDAICAFISGLITLASIVMIGPMKGISINLKKGIDRFKDLLMGAIKKGTRNAFASFSASEIVSGFLQNLADLSEKAETIKEDLANWLNAIIKKIKQEIKDLPQEILDEIGNPANIVADFARVIGTVVNGIKWFRGQIQDAIAGKRTELASIPQPDQAWIASISNKGPESDTLAMTA